MAITATVTPGKQFASGDPIDYEALNQLGKPTIDIQGTVGSLSLSDGSVTNVKIAAGTKIDVEKIGLAQGKLVVGDGSDDAQELTLLSTQIVVGNASNQATAVTTSGDVLVSNTGALTIQADAVTEAKVINDAITIGKINWTAGTTKSTGADADTMLVYSDGDSANRVMTLANLQTYFQGALVARAWANVDATTAFDTTAISITGCDSGTKVITAASSHGFSTEDPVVFWADDAQSDTSGFSTDTVYWVEIIGATTFYLHSTKAEALAGASGTRIAPADNSISANLRVVAAEAAGLNSVGFKFVLKSATGKYWAYFSAAQPNANYSATLNADIAAAVHVDAQTTARIEVTGIQYDGVTASDPAERLNIMVIGDAS